MQTLANISTDQHQVLRESSRDDPKFWGNTPAAHKVAVAGYKQEVKEFYFDEQGRRCCYCSLELADHGRTYDYEHILCVSTYPQFAFELNNVAISCVPCNSGKSAKHVLVAADVPPAVPQNADEYQIVHPHLDEWSDHLAFDGFDRVVPTADSPKGLKTIEICEIHRLNLARLADTFRRGRRDAENAMHRLVKAKSSKKRQKHLDFLKALADASDLAPARAVVAALRVEHLDE